ncbi:MAG: translation initiation factor IF-1 [Acidobacteriota bacterium]|nr:translation initiation factor IF-1 [Acidobacteriota bacterium]
MDEPQAPPGNTLRPVSKDEEAQGRAAEGVVRELLPSQLVRVELEGRHYVTAHLASPVGRNYVRIVVGDRVRVALMANDPSRGRVVEKL